MSNTNLDETSDFLFYKGVDGSVSVQVIVGEDTVWTTQKGMAEIFNIEVPGISKHIKNIFDSGELNENSVISKMETTASDGKTYLTAFYNLDVIIAVGYRVNSYQATQFRIWATKIVNEYLVKGFALDDERLKQGKTLFGKDYFNELLDRIKEIRASERRFYQKITDIYAACSADYDPNSPITQTFFSTVQNKLEFAITKHTAAEIIKSRANSTKPHMGLTTWKNAPNGKVLKGDISVAKNYLSKTEIDELNSIVVMYLDYAELQAKKNKLMKMGDWVNKLDAFLTFNEYEILQNAGRIKHAVAVSFAEKQYEKFRVIQDKEYKSDFDKVVEGIKTTGKLPKEPIEPKKEQTPFDKTLKAILSVPKPDKEDLEGF